ncbi:MAG TPA: NTP transferase domain-containing protein [Propionibacteriaceae bacterium]|nr:NTP transferase domain-containing protein [Propionibacteriaceae bacterium]
MVLAGGASHRFPPDKLAQLVEDQPLLDRALASLPEQFLVVVVGSMRQVTRRVIFTSEDPPGGGPAAAMIAGVRRALAESADVIVVLPADAPLGGQAARTLLGRLEDEPSAQAVVGVDAHGREQPLQLALRPAAAEALLTAAGPGGAAGVSARRLLDVLRPGLVTQELAPAELWDIDTADQLLVWRLRSSAAVLSIMDVVTERQAGASGSPVVIAIDGPSCAGKSILATALALRSGAAAVVEGDDFYRHTLPRLTVPQREAMSDAAVADAVIDWERLRAEALLPLRARRSATFPPYDWDADDGRLAPPKIIPPADVIIVEGVYAARPELTDLVDVAVYLGADPQVRARRYAARENDPDWQRFWERGEAHYFRAVRPAESFDIRLDDQDLRNVRGA